MGMKMYYVAIKTNVHNFDSADIIKNLVSPYFKEVKANEINLGDWDSLITIEKSDEFVWIGSYPITNLFFDENNSELFLKYHKYFDSTPLMLGLKHIDFNNTSAYSIIR
jgi:hypothetical protein